MADELKPPLGPGDSDPKSPTVSEPASFAPPLGPGDEDLKSPSASADVPPKAPLSPGDEDPASPALGTPDPLREPLKAGDRVGENPDEDFDYLVQPPSGPGSSAQPMRQITRVPKRVAVEATPLTTVPPAEEPEALESPKEPPEERTRTRKKGSRRG
jgi:hypothetical protein